jgi:CxxC-x17-CxxC domain-containing protein
VALSDKTLVCVECGSEFIFTVGEQEFFQARGFGNEPKRCRSCRAVRRTEQRGGGGGGGGGMYQDGPREMYPIVCAECGNDAMVPFRPRGDRPVYCSDCFSRMREESSSGF